MATRTRPSEGLSHFFTAGGAVLQRLQLASLPRSTLPAGQEVMDIDSDACAAGNDELSSHESQCRVVHGESLCSTTPTLVQNV